MAILKDAFIPDYRVRLFECLGGMPEIEYVVIHGHAPRSTGHHAAAPPFSFSELAVENRELRIAGRTLVYQPKVRKVVGSEFDAAVIGMELKLLSNVALFARMKVRDNRYCSGARAATSERTRVSQCESSRMPVHS